MENASERKTELNFKPRLIQEITTENQSAKHSLSNTDILYLLPSARWLCVCFLSVCLSVCLSVSRIWLKKVVDRNGTQTLAGRRNPENMEAIGPQTERIE